MKDGNGKQKKIKLKQPTKSGIGGDFLETVKILSTTPPISNEEIVKRSKKNKSNK